MKQQMLEKQIDELRLQCYRLHQEVEFYRKMNSPDVQNVSYMLWFDDDETSFFTEVKNIFGEWWEFNKVYAPEDDPANYTKFTTLVSATNGFMARVIGELDLEDKIGSVESGKER